MIEQMREARAAHKAARTLRESVLWYIANVKERGLLNDPAHFAPVLEAIIGRIKEIEIPSDQVTYKNEYHYRRFGKQNDVQAAKQRQRRKANGTSSAQESIQRLNASNALRRLDHLPNDYQPSAPSTAPTIPGNIPWQEQYKKDHGHYPGEGKASPAMILAPIDNHPKHNYKSVLDNVEEILEPDPDAATPESIHNAIAAGGLFANDEILPNPLDKGESTE